MPNRHFISSTPPLVILPKGGWGAFFGLASNGNNRSMPIRNENETKQVSFIVRMVMRLVDQMAFGKMSARPNDPAPKKSRDRIFDEREDLNDL